LSYCNRPC